MTITKKHLEFLKINKREGKNAAVRFMEIKQILQKNKDKRLLKMLEDLLKYCDSYINYVVNFELKVKELRRKYEGSVLRREIEEIDRRRIVLHNALISNLESLNRNLGKKYGWESSNGQIPLGGVYSLNPSTIRNRIKVGDWAWYLISGLFIESKKD